MQLKKLAAATTIILVLSSPVSAMANFQPVVKDKQIQHEHRLKEKERDPIKALEAKKERVKELLKEGKITKEKAEEIIQRLDNKIEKVKEFQSLPLEEKRKRVINNLTIELERLVKEGKMTKQDADQLLKEASDKIKKWDGTGYPNSIIKGKDRTNK